MGSSTDPTYGWRVPVPADPPDVPGDLQALAADAAATVQRALLTPAPATGPLMVQYGETTITLNNEISKDGTIDYPTPFSAVPLTFFSCRGVSATLIVSEKWGSTASQCVYSVRNYLAAPADATFRIHWLSIGAP